MTPQEQLSLRMKPTIGYWKFLLRGGRSRGLIYIPHAIWIIMMLRMIIVPEDRHPWIWFLCGIMSIGSILAISIDYVVTQFRAYQEKIRIYHSPQGWHDPIEQDWMIGPVQHGKHNMENTTSSYDWIKAPWMDTAMILPHGFGKEVASVANRAYREGRKIRKP